MPSLFSDTVDALRRQTEMTTASYVGETLTMSRAISISYDRDGGGIETAGTYNHRLRAASTLHGSTDLAETTSLTMARTRRHVAREPSAALGPSCGILHNAAENHPAGQVIANRNRAAPTKYAIRRMASKRRSAESAGMPRAIPCQRALFGHTLRHAAFYRNGTPRDTFFN